MRPHICKDPCSCMLNFNVFYIKKMYKYDVKSMCNNHFFKILIYIILRVLCLVYEWFLYASEANNNNKKKVTIVFYDEIPRILPSHSARN